MTGSGECARQGGPLYLQVTLKDFQTTMKVAKGKEAASLPKKKAAVAQSPFAQSQDTESAFHSSEQQALLQVKSIVGHQGPICKHCRL